MERFQKIVSTIELFPNIRKKSPLIRKCTSLVCEFVSVLQKASNFLFSMCPCSFNDGPVYNESDCEVNQGKEGHVMNFASLIRCPRHSLRPRLPICFSRLVPSHNSFFWLSLWHSRNAERGKKIELHFWTESKQRCPPAANVAQLVASFHRNSAKNSWCPRIWTRLTVRMRWIPRDWVKTALNPLIRN